VKTLKYDVVVVGGGPAGSSVARYAARGGAKVLMLEKRQEVGSPVRCGEGVSKKILQKIELEPLESWIANEVAGAKIISPSGSQFELSEDLAGSETGYIIRRDIFDKHLAKLAAVEGADIMVKTTATSLIKEDGKIKGVLARHLGEEYRIEATVTVAADGFEARLSREAGLKTSLKLRDVDICIQYEMVGVKADPLYTEFYVGQGYAPGGYVWIFPKSERVANVGIGVNLMFSERGATPRRYLEKFIASREDLKGAKIVEINGGAVSVSMPPESVTLPGFAAVGDSARMIDPLTGGGVVNGAVAGRVLGEALGRMVQGKLSPEEALAEYEKGWRKKMEVQLARNYLAKEKLLELTDEEMNDLIEAVGSIKLEGLSTAAILKAVKEAKPSLAEKFSDFL